MRRPGTRPTRRATARVTPALAIVGVCLAGSGLAPLPGVLAAAGARAADGATWQARVSAGYDVYVHTYSLAEDDTTETVSEAALTAGFAGRSARDAKHQWSLRGEVSAGTELVRELLDATWRWQPDGGDRLRADLAWYGRQYREQADYGLTSDNQEGRAELRLHPWRGAGLGLDLQAGLRWLDYASPSTLEQDYTEPRAGFFLSSRGDLARSWRLGGFVASRSYPDSSAIDRETAALEATWEQTAGRGDLWLFHRSERREVADPDARPSAWSHWSEGRTAVPAGAGAVVAALTSEVWRYDHESGAYFDSWRLDGEAGYRWGDLLGVQWQGLLTVEHLAAGDSPETYTQVGLRGSLESYAAPFSGVVALEFGRRWYRDPGAVDLADLADPADPLDDPLLIDDLVLAYSDFDYLEIWVMASLAVSDHLSLDVTASYEPESHTEQDDDIALGYGSVRLVWRP